MESSSSFRHPAPVRSLPINVLVTHDHGSSPPLQSSSDTSDLHATLRPESQVDGISTIDPPLVAHESLPPMPDPRRTTRSSSPLSAPFSSFGQQNPMSSSYHFAPSPHGPPSQGPYTPYDRPYGHYIAATQHPPVAIDNTPAHFAYLPTYPSQAQQDYGDTSSHINPNYSPLSHPRPPVYSYQSSDAIPSLSGTASRYQPLASYPPPNQFSPSHPTSIPSSASSRLMDYSRRSPFSTLNYSASPSAPYPYPMPPYPSSPPVYHSPYPPFEPSFGPDRERQSAWWYPVPPQFRSGLAAYPNPYPGPSNFYRQAVEPSYLSAPSPPSSLPISPLRPISQPSPTHSSLSPSPRNHGPSLSASPRPQAPASAREKPVIRRSYHPNPPSHRSEWVMWVGNVPLNATHDELWRFFTKTPEGSAPPSPTPGSDPGQGISGVLSIFLISRSNCAFVNYSSEENLQRAISWFNGKALRAADARSPKLVCRVRKKEDDLKAGVGGQRGAGIHMKWIKEHSGKRAADGGIAGGGAGGGAMPKSRSVDQIGVKTEAPILKENPQQNQPSRHEGNQSSSLDSGSGSSTSSVLGRFFPKRYFILKSLTQSDLDLSVEKGLWATQKHNEGILDQAYRTSLEVFLIFSVNKSGEFYGYARMAGPIRRGEHSVSWASRTTDSLSSISPPRSSDPSSSSLSPNTSSRVFLTPGSNRLVEDSPMEIQTEDRTRATVFNAPHPAPAGKAQSAPAEFGATRRGYSLQTSQAPALSYNTRASAAPAFPPVAAISVSGDDFELDPEAPVRAMRSHVTITGSMESRPSNRPTLDAVAEEEERGGEDLGPEANAQPALSTEKDEENENATAAQQPRDEGWGESFKVDWIATEKLPFNRTRHLRNPWNHDREVKVSRDGTELEPIIGQKLLDEWFRLREKVVVVPKTMRAGKEKATPRPSYPRGGGGATPGMVPGHELPPS